MTGFDQGTKAIVTMKNDLTQVFSDLTFYFYSATSLFQYFSIVFTLVLVITVVITFGSQFVICFRMQDKCHAMSCLTRGSVALLGLASVALTGILLLFVLLNFSVGGLCDFAYQGTLEAGDIGDVASTVPTSTATFMSADCMKKGGAGLVPEKYLPLSDTTLEEKFTNVGTFLHGYSTFNNFLKNKQTSDSDSAIAHTQTKWNLYETGILFNFNNVEGTLGVLNSNVSPCKEQWVLNSQNCTSVQTGNLCKAVSTTDTFDKARDCVTSKQDAQDSFDKMKNYLQGQGIMMSKMILDLAGGQETSPKSNVELTSSKTWRKSSTMLRQI